MKHFAYVEPGPDNEPITTVMSEQEILDSYYPYWQEQMRKVGKADLISEAFCLEDWIAVNWAAEVDEEGAPMRMYVVRADWIDRQPFVYQLRAPDLAGALMELATTMFDALSGAAEITVTEIPDKTADTPR